MSRTRKGHRNVSIKEMGKDKSSTAQPNSQKGNLKQQRKTEKTKNNINPEHKPREQKKKKRRR
jgi:hypothetical protein